MSAEYILHNVGLSRERVGELCEKYGRRVEPARPREVDFTGCRFHRLVERAASSTDSSTEGGVR